MNFEHSTVKIAVIAPGLYSISGHQPASVFLPDVGHYVPSSECCIPPEVPSEALIAILEARNVLDDSEDLLDLIRAELPAGLDADTPQEIATAISMMREQVGAMEAVRDDLAAEVKQLKQAAEAMPTAEEWNALRDECGKLKATNTALELEKSELYAELQTLKQAAEAEKPKRTRKAAQPSEEPEPFDAGDEKKEGAE